MTKVVDSATATTPWKPLEVDPKVGSAALVSVNADAARSWFLSADEEILFSASDSELIGLPAADREHMGVRFLRLVRAGWSHAWLTSN